MKYKNILFDLDGTLTDSGPGIRNAAAHALLRFGIVENDKEALNRFIGPPLYDSFNRFYNIDNETAKLGENYFREYYADKGIYENSLYDGIDFCLDMLKKKGFRLFVATSKPDFMAQTVASHFDIKKYFDGIYGADIENNICEKHQVIKLLLDERQDVLPSECLMVGDRRHDVEGARVFGIPCIGVLWGYGSHDELVKSGALATVDEPQGLLEYILDKDF